jgi:4-amino-4-deoxy-L-arabinose transferase-like glycosyltransferase
VATIWAIAQVGVTTAAATAVGSWIRGERISAYHPLLRWALRTAIGFLILAYALVVLAQIHQTTPDRLRIFFALLVAIGLAWAGVAVLRGRAAKSASLVEIRVTRVTIRPEALLAIAAAAAYVVWMVLVGSLPATAADELIHHLAVPKRMLAAGGDVFFADNIYAYFPPLGDMWFLFGLGVGGETSARLFQTPFAVVLSAAIYGFARHYVSAAGAVGAVALFVSVPSVIVVTPSAYVDVTFALYTFLAFVLLVSYLETRWRGWIVLSGAMAGGALGTKYTGLQITMLLVLVVLLDHVAARRRGLPMAAVMLPAIAIVMSLPFLLRNAIVTGWPLFPFPIGSWPIAGHVNWDGERASLFLSLLATYGSSADPIAPASLWDAIVSPLLVFVAGAFNDPRRYDGIVGPIFLLAPFAVGRVGREPTLRHALLFSAAFLLYWGLTVRQIRFLIPVLPIASVLVMVAVERWRSRVAYALVAAAAVFSSILGIRQTLAREPWAYWSGWESRDAFLERHVPGYAMYRAANEALGPHDRLFLISMGNYGYYLNPEWRSDFVFETYRLEKALGRAVVPGDLAEFFRSQAITDVLIDERLTFGSGVLEPHKRALLRQFFAERASVVSDLRGQVLYRLRQ